MITVVIAALDAGRTLGAALNALDEGLSAGLIEEIVVVDGGSSDATADIAQAHGARVIEAARGRGAQLAAGAGSANTDWLMFLHADTILETGWSGEAARFLSRAEPAKAAAFTFALDDGGLPARILERMVGLRNRVFRLPYGDQGLLIGAARYVELGGYRPLPLMEDVDLVRRIGRRHIVVLKSRAVTSAARYRRDGYVRRPIRNLFILTAYFCGVSSRILARWYGHGNGRT